MRHFRSARCARFVMPFVSETRGTIIVIFALVLVPLLLVCGMGIDLMRVNAMKRHVQQAVDAAALAAAREYKDLSVSIDTLRSAAVVSFIENMASRQSDIGCRTFSVSQIMSDYGVTVTAECSVPATLGGGIFGPSRHTVTVDAKAEGPVSKMDLALVLDVSSSMMANTKISDMKSAATLLVSKVITADTGTRVRVSVVPYATGVNAGQYGNIALDRSVGDDADGDGLDRVCVVERTMGEQFTDAPPGPGQYMEALNPDPNTQAYYGPLESNRVLPLTSTASDLTTLIGNLNPNPLTGPTIGHAGIAWGWYTLSPKWSSIWPSDSNPLPMNTLRNRKVMVIMSDGAFSFPLDSSMGTASEQAEALCAAARLAGVEIFTVGFDFASIADSTARQTAIDTMANCATDSEHAFLATDATQLHNAFADIAAQLFAGTALVE